MKKTIVAIIASAFVVGAVLTSCNTPAEKVANAQDNVVQANKELNDANQEYLTDIDNYKKEQLAKIEANNQSIAEYNKRKDNKKIEAKSEYNKKIADLEQENADMKKKLDDYKAEGKDKWEIFKEDFSRKMDELGKSIKNLSAK